MGDLVAVWRRIDARFWGGRLPMPTLRWGEPPAGALAVTSRRRGAVTVTVSPRVLSLGGAGAARALHDVLLHESVHVVLRFDLGEHGPRFARQARRVAPLLGLPPPTRGELSGWPLSARTGAYSALPEHSWRPVG